MRSEATTVKQYLAELPDDRRAAVQATRDLVLANLPPGYVEEIGWGMINWVIPLTTFPDTYNKKPLMCAAVGSQKNYVSLYLMGLYMAPSGEDDFRKAWNGPKKLNMGKSCIRFKSFDELDQPLIAKTIQSWPVDTYLKHYQATRGKS